MRLLFRAAASIVIALLAVSAPLLAQNAPGTITGVVTDSTSGAPLAGALVTIEGTAFVTPTDRSGVYQLGGVPAGSYELVVSYLGHADQRAQVTVRSSELLRVNVGLAR